MKKLICSLLIATTVILTHFTSFAAVTEIQHEVKSEIIAIRENVSREEAMRDNNFNVAKSILSNNFIEKRSVEWKVWGSSINTSTGATPIGYSEHRNGNTVLSTYHYTRTYLGELLKRGDSGRVWGTHTVKATGTFLAIDVWSAHTHIVKYGTED